MEALDGVAVRRVDDVQEHARALEMREELVAEAGAVCRALDEPRDVRDRELARVRALHGAEHRLDRRERVVGDLRLRIRDATQERRLPGIREPGERGVDDELEAKREVRLLAGKPGLREARRLPGRRREARVAATSAAALRDDEPRIRRGQVGDEPPVGVEHLRAERHTDLRVLTVGSVLPAPAAAPALAGAHPPDAPERREIAERRVGHDEHVAAAPSVAAVRPALRHVLLAPEAERAVAAASRLDVDLRAIVETACPPPARQP